MRGSKVPEAAKGCQGCLRSQGVRGMLYWVFGSPPPLWGQEARGTRTVREVLGSKGVRVCYTSYLGPHHVCGSKEWYIILGVWVRTISGEKAMGMRGQGVCYTGSPPPLWGLGAWELRGREGYVLLGVCVPTISVGKGQGGARRTRSLSLIEVPRVPKAAKSFQGY